MAALRPEEDACGAELGAHQVTDFSVGEVEIEAVVSGTLTIFGINLLVASIGF